MCTVNHAMADKINDFDLGEGWKERLQHIYTQDLWIIPKREGEAGSGDFKGNFIPLIPLQMMLRYTCRGELVLDPCAGSGTTLDVAKSIGRQGLGYDLNPCRPDIIQGDVLTERYPMSQLVIFHPPYHNAIKYSESPSDLSNCGDVHSFLASMKRAVCNLDMYLQNGRYFVLVLGRVYTEGEMWDLGSRVANWMQDTLDYRLKGVVAKDFGWSRRNVGLWRYRALKHGYWQFKWDGIYVLQKPGALIIGDDGDLETLCEHEVGHGGRGHTCDPVNHEGVCPKESGEI